MKQTLLTNLRIRKHPNTGKSPDSRVIDVQPSDVKSCQSF